jgi:hypothetical protein
MTNYPKALEEFLESVPKEFKNAFDLIMDTKIGKAMLKGLTKLDEVSFDNMKTTKKFMGGKSIIDKNKKLKVILSQVFFEDIEKNALMFAFILSHELVHAVQKINIAKAKNLELTLENILPEKEIKSPCYTVLECDADRKSMNMLQEANLVKNTKQYKEIEEFLISRYGKKININSSYNEMKKAYSEIEDKRILKYIESFASDKKLYDRIKNNLKANAVVCINDKDVLEFEKMVLGNYKNQQNRFNQLPNSQGR